MSEQSPSLGHTVLRNSWRCDPLVDGKTDDSGSWHKALETLRAHLEQRGGTCLESGCQICHRSQVQADVGRLRVAQEEYRLKFEPLPRLIQDCLCVYCGDLPSDRDHLLPRTWTGGTLRKFVPTVPSCRSCNSIISDFPDPNILSRSSHVREALSMRWARRLANNPSLDGLTGRLRSQIAANNFKRDVIRGRLLVLGLGGVPELPSEWWDQLMTAGPAGLIDGSELKAEPPIYEPKTVRKCSTNSQTVSKKTNKKPVHQINVQTPGGAYLARTSRARGLSNG